MEHKKQIEFLKQMKDHYEKEWRNLYKLFDKTDFDDEDVDAQLQGQFEDFIGIISEDVCEGIKTLSDIIKEVEKAGKILKTKLDESKARKNTIAD